MKKIKNIIKTTIREYLNENYHINQLKDILNELKIDNYEILGIGQHGIAILNKDNNKVYKFTKSNNEYDIAKKQYEYKTQSLPKIYKYDKINGYNYYIRDNFIPINDNLGEKIGEENDDLDEFFYSNVNDVRKSETNLIYNFDDKFLNFLNNLKRDLKILGIKNEFDIDGMPINIYQNKYGDYVLADF